MPLAPSWLAGAGVVLLVVAVGGYVYTRRGDVLPRPESSATTTPDEGEGGGDLAPPRLKGSRLGVLGEFYHWYKRQQQIKRKAGKGYVMWYLFEDSWPEPRFVQPESEGAGVLEYKHDGETYLFDREAMLPDRRTGMWVAAHNADDGTPINLREPDEHAIDPGVLQRWKDAHYQIEPPSFWDQLDIDWQALWKLGIGAAIALAVLYHVNATLL